jgi:ArsR family transcriptional regulator, arsenate/arsenite/antimonite-responsive transcriptional repressor
MTKQRNVSGARLTQLVDAAKGLAHPARLRLVGMLATGELCVCQMTSVLELAPSTVSQHLSVLARGGLVAERKEGKLVFYRLRDDAPVASLLAPLLELLAADPEAQADRRLVARLRRIPVATLCAADLDLVAIGVRRPAAATAAAAPRA